MDILADEHIYMHIRIFMYVSVFESSPDKRILAPRKKTTTYHLQEAKHLSFTPQ